MKKILFRAFILCSLIPSMWLSAANAIGEDAECLSLENDSGAIFSVCLEGDVSKAKLTNRTKSQLLELAHQLKKTAVAEPLAKKSNYGYGGMYSDYYSIPTQTPVVTTPSYTDYSDSYPAVTTQPEAPTPNYSDYSESYTTTQPEAPTTPDYTDYYDNYTVEEPDDNSVTPEVNEPDPYDMCAMYPSYPGCSS